MISTYKGGLVMNMSVGKSIFTLVNNLKQSDKLCVPVGQSCPKFLFVRIYFANILNKIFKAYLGQIVRVRAARCSVHDTSDIKMTILWSIGWDKVSQESGSITCTTISWTSVVNISQLSWGDFGLKISKILILL